MGDFPWWDHLYNKASKNLSVDVEEDGNVTVKAVSAPTEITHKAPTEQVKAVGKGLFYGSFVKVDLLNLATISKQTPI